MSLLAHWRDIPLTDPRVEAVVDALIQESKSLTDSPQTWRAAQIAVAALADHDQGAVAENEKLRLQVAALENDGMELAARLGEAEEQIALGGQ
jgi:hypothetical protein